MNIFMKMICKVSGFRKLEGESDALILDVTNLNPKRLPRELRSEARRVLKDLYKSKRQQINIPSAAMIKLAFYCRGYEVTQDIQSRSRIASAIKVLRQSTAGANISEEASEFSFSYAGV